MTAMQYDSLAVAQPVTVATYVRYEQAEAAVDRLSDAGFPVSGVTIEGRDVTTVEQVTGRLTVARAALYGLGGGAWTGLMIGLLMSLFLPGAGWFGLILTAAFLGAAFGAVAGAIGHGLTRGRRDFSSIRSMRAAAYAVVVDSMRADEATRIIAGMR
jgi:hypothetical protein